MKQNNITYEDNYSYRQLLQKSGPELFDKIRSDTQGVGPCTNCNKPMVDTSKIY